MMIIINKKKISIKGPILRGNYLNAENMEKLLVLSQIFMTYS